MAVPCSLVSQDKTQQVQDNTRVSRDKLDANLYITWGNPRKVTNKPKTIQESKAKVKNTFLSFISRQAA